MLKLLSRAALFAAVAFALAACQDGKLGNAKAYAPIPAKTVRLMQDKGMSTADPILIRSYKKESEVEIWKRDSKGEFALLKTYPICRWSGQLGPKIKEGDRQAPEGFYNIRPAQMNPNSSFYLSFDTGFPNSFDRANGRTGSHLMVHGACSSRGCFSMTDEQIAEIYAIGREAFAGGQRSFQFQSYPFRMTAENLAKHRNDQHIEFWKMLKEGSDYFEVTKQEPGVGVCNKRYVFGVRPPNGAPLDTSGSCQPLKADEQIMSAVRQKQQADQSKVADLVAQGTRAVKVVYQDGSQHPSFRTTALASPSAESIFTTVPATTGSIDVSRPEALASAPHEVEIGHQGAAANVATALAPAAPAKAGEDTARQAAPAPQLAAHATPDQAAALANATSLAPLNAAGAPESVPEKSSATSFIKRALTLEGLIETKKKPVESAMPADGSVAVQGETRAAASGTGQPPVPGN